MTRVKLLLVLLTVLLLVPTVYAAEAQCTPRADWTATYTVVRGDTLYRIGLRYSLTVTTLAQGNCLPNSNYIYAGQVLRVPGTSTGGPISVYLPTSTTAYYSPYSPSVLATLLPGMVTAQGRSADTNWIFVRTANVQGWVWSYALQIDSSSIYALPVTNQQGSIDGGTGNQCTLYLPTRLSVGMQARVTPGAPNNVRSTPTTSGYWVGTLVAGTVMTVISGPQCNGGILWWQVNANGIVGWTGELQGATYWLEPATSNTGAVATVNTYFLNVRSLPNATAYILTQIQRGASYAIVGRRYDSRWLQLNVNGIVGWVNASYVVATNVSSVPITA